MLNFRVKYSRKKISAFVCTSIFCFLAFSVIIRKTGVNIYAKNQIETNKQSQELVHHKLHKLHIQRRFCWVFDQKSWTLYQLFPACPRKKSAKKSTKIKRIVYYNGTVEYPVCNKNTPKCKELPRYSRKLHAMIEKPPCCIAHILETFEHIVSAFDRIGIHYFLTAGGLIGAVKSQAIPRHEGDLDILVENDHWNTLLFNQTLSSLETRFDHYIDRHPKTPNFIRVFYSKINKVFVDMWPYKVYTAKDGKHFVRAVSNLTWHSHPYDTVFPLKGITFSGISTWIPNKPEAVLDTHYGGKFDWRKPILCKKKSDKKCIE